MSNRPSFKSPYQLKNEYHFHNKENKGTTSHQHSLLSNTIKRDLQELKEGIQEINKMSSEISTISKLLKDLRNEVNDLKDQQMEILLHFNKSTSETMNQNKYQNSLDANGLKQALEDPKFMMSVFNYSKINEFLKLRY